ncbi:MAG: hypothetical protein EOP21_02930 [Hyphomicrobiales bacterium]|nr:MAG: hypothetical protein EOP21_02930 [Hyphomicrobiales bacterium]
MPDNWIRTDEARDVAGSIRHVILVSKFVEEDPLTWKWVVLALHSALQGACVCHLTKTAAPVGAVTRRNAVEWLEYFESSRTNPEAKPPKTHLMGLPDLLKTVRRPHSAGGPGDDVDVTISDSELGWLVRFHDGIRNQFVHFEPIGWSIEVSGIPKLTRLAARIIESIVRVGWAFRHLTLQERQEMQRDLKILASLNWPI